MRRFLPIVLCLMVLAGCAAPALSTTESIASTETLPPATTPDTTAAQTEPEKDDLSLLREALQKECSFSVRYQYMHLGFNGISQEINQEHALDGSFHFISSTKLWDHTQEYESIDQAEYYYHYEDDVMVCYVRANGAEPNRMTLTQPQEQELAASKNMLVGPDGLLPGYLEDFRQESDTTYSFRLPLSRVIKDGTLLTAFVSNAFALYGSEFDPESGIYIGCTMEVEKDTGNPLSFTYDFTELKPYVLSDGALSGEYALNMELMYMVFTLDYALADTIQVPESFIP